MENKGRGWYNKNRYCKKITDLEYIEAEEYCMDQQVKRVKRELVKNGAILDIYTDTENSKNGILFHTEKGRQPLFRYAETERF